MATREERQARRAARKAKRKERRANRSGNRQQKREQLALLLEAARTTDLSTRPGEGDIPFVEVFGRYWKLFRPGLLYIKATRWSGTEADNTIADIVVVGDAIAEGGAGAEQESEFKDKINSIWEPISWALEFAQNFTGDDVDEVLDDIIEIGDWMTSNNGN